MLHRDLKPDNILVGDDGIVRVADFGFARFFGERGASPDSLGDSLTTAGAVGTPAYLAPEYRRGDPPTIACDVFSFSVTAWEALTGTRPTDGEGKVEISAGEAIAPELRDVLVAGMQAEADDRPAGIGTLERALRGALDRSRRGTARWLAVAGAGALCVGGWIWWASREPSRTEVAAVDSDGTEATPAVKSETVAASGVVLRESIGVDATRDANAPVPGWARQIRRADDPPEALDAWSIPVVTIDATDGVAPTPEIRERMTEATALARERALGIVEVVPLAAPDITAWASLVAPLAAQDDTLVAGGLPHATDGAWAERVTGDLGRIRGWAARHADGRFPAAAVSLAVDTPTTDAEAKALQHGALEVTAYRDEHLPQLGLWASLSPGREADVVDAWLQLWAAGFSRVFVPAGHDDGPVVALLTRAGTLRARGPTTAGDHDARIVRLVDDDTTARMLLVWRRDAAAASVRVTVGDAHPHSVPDGPPQQVTGGSTTVSVASTPVLIELR